MTKPVRAGMALGMRSDAIDEPLDLHRLAGAAARALRADAASLRLTRGATGKFNTTWFVAQTARRYGALRIAQELR